MRDRVKFILSILIIVIIGISCSNIKDIIYGDRLYFCERYDSNEGEIGESSEFTTGNLTVMLRLKEPILVSNVDINITDLSSKEVVQTIPFNVESNWDYIHFDDINFSTPGKFKVSCLKKDGTVIASNEVKITDNK